MMYRIMINDIRKLRIYTIIIFTQPAFCLQTFGLKQYIEKHIASVHDMIKAYQCKLCKVFLSQKCSLNNHMRKVHAKSKGPKLEKTIPCELCAKVNVSTYFDSKFKLNFHLRKRHNVKNSISPKLTRGLTRRFEQ